MISLILPTRNEWENLERLVYEIGSMLNGEAYEIIFVDDSDDSLTRKVIQQLELEHKGKIRGLFRMQSDGLAGAVIDGFSFAKGDYLIVMDADFQHPPSIVKAIAEKLQESDIVVAKRTGNQGFENESRKAASSIATKLAHFLLSSSRRTTDPMSGCFGIRRSALLNVDLQATGWKILLEVLSKVPKANISEVDYTFGERNAGESKFGRKAQIQYLLQLVKLSSKEKWFSYSIVGGLGVLLNLIAMNLFYMLLSMSGINHAAMMIASIAAGWLTTGVNYGLNAKHTWKECESGFVAYYVRGVIYTIVSAVGILTTTAIMQNLTNLGSSPAIGQLCGILFTSIVTYQIHKRITFATWGRSTSHEQRKHAL